MQTSKKRILPATGEKLTLFQEVSPVNRTQPLGNDSGKRTNAIYGPKCLESLERLPRVTSWAKTFSALLIGTGDWYSKRCVLIWKMRATMYSRIYCQLRAKTRPIEGRECGLLQTPSTMEIKENPTEFQTRAKIKGYRNGTTYNSLRSQLIYDPNWSHLYDGIHSRTNPRFVAEMMGFPPNWTELPFQNGETNQLKHTETP